MTRFRFGLAIGLAAGYVLGTRAGRERYAQIERAARSIWGSAPAVRAREEVSSAVPSMVHSAVAKVGELRHREPHNGELAATPGISGV